MAPTLLFHSNAELLEGPIFDIENKLLYFVSIFDCLVYCYNPTTKEILSVKLESPVSCVFILGDNKVMASSKNGFYEINFKTLENKFAFQLDVEDTVRYNDGIKDAKGRFIIGTMGYPKVMEKAGNVFSYDNGHHKKIIENTTISNGLAFSKNDDVLYFIDTPTNKVAKYLYDINTGDVIFDSYVIEFLGEGSPDGMCMDFEGMLWIAEWGGACVSRWNPANGKKLNELKLPCTNVTSCCFDDKANLYVTTAKSEAENKNYSGGLFYIELN
ncbi:SMP-30/gluconolactonase/LRE family protein [Flagellimonas zhangzhouensis]|uniref:Sugar lactone lactonase YvrE n=1 Tax=Flagellimonas zhangzhouensis TaxID=1073328 RepID=A0A1H2YRX3_9FLAO|nr:SMP-30/gluconolactonase/LRE family protein [Allomuricauda zhangzhouensis]SDR00447.1 Sugar lactone lactonase YvrE [Allomuricauda zhangzhouensis]SDX07384.1 Sugar lactone lactonase YvrE [Allomuricauda zhangzhouensis]